MSHKDACLIHINDLIDKILVREQNYCGLSEESKADLGYIKIHATELTKEKLNPLLSEALNELDAIAKSCPHFATAALAERKAFSIRSKLKGD